MFVLDLPATPTLRLSSPKTLILALVQECPISDPPPIPHTKSYLERDFESKAPYIIDLETISAVVGRLSWQGRSYILDRTGDTVDPAVPVADM
jgi:hypothetical protein